MPGEYGPSEAERAFEVKPSDESKARSMTAEQIRSAKLHEGEMLRGGAEIDAEGKIAPTEHQVEQAKNEMEQDIMVKKLGQIFSEGEVSTIIAALTHAGQERSGEIGGPYHKTSPKEAENLGQKLLDAIQTSNKIKRGQ